MNDKEVRVNLDGLKMLDERLLAAVIDSLVEYYAENYGLTDLSDIPQPPPSKPSYECEDLSIAKEYLQKYRIVK
jgi:hypothetical protein